MNAAIVRLALEGLYVSGVHALLRPLLGGVGAILQFRHVRPPRREAFQPFRSLEITPPCLRAIVTRLRRWNYDLVSLDEMHRRLSERDLARRFACLTFDDGYRDTSEFAYPILKAEGVPFAIYVPTSFPDRRGRLWWRALEAIVAGNDGIDLAIGDNKHRFECRTLEQKRDLFAELYGWVRAKPTDDELLAAVADLSARHGVDMNAMGADACMNWRELAELGADPLVTIGAHTVNHVRLAKATEAVVRSELAMGASVLETAFGRRPRHLAYPFGGPDAAGAREFAIARELGFTTAVTARPGLLRGGDRDRLMALPRLAVAGQFQSRRHLRVMMSGAATCLWRRIDRLDAA